MTKEEVKKIILSTVISVQGCKWMELIFHKNLKTIYKDSEDHQVNDIIDELIREKKLIEVSYILPTLNDRIKSFLLPLGTEIYLNDKKITGESNV